MTVYSLFDNFVGPPSVNTSNQQETFASAFDALSGGGVTGLRWYACDTNVAHKPTGLVLWDGVSATQLAVVTTLTHAGTVGWQTVALGTPVQTTPGRRYVVSMTMGAGSPQAYTATNAAATPPLEWAAQPKVTNSGGNYNTYPNTATTNYWWVDVVWDDTQGAAGGTGESVDYSQVVQATSQALNSWLSTTGNDYPSISTPYLNKALLDALTSNVDNIASGDVATYGLSARSIGAGISGVLGFVNTALDLATKLHSLLSTNGTGGDTYDYHGALEDTRQKAYDNETAIATVQASLDDLAASLLAFRNWSTGRDLDETRLDTPDTYVVNGYGYLATGKTVHRISVGTVPAEVGQVDFGSGGVWLPRFGWWAPVTPQGALLERHFIDWHDQWLWPAPHNMAGIAYHLPLGVDATIYAYDPLEAP